MWIVKLALSSPYTFILLSLVLILISPVILLRTPVDIFPNINIPVISVIWSYNGLAPSEMGTRIVAIFERSLTTTGDRRPGCAQRKNNQRRESDDRIAEVIGAREVQEED